MVVIDHGDSYLSIYGHVDERLVLTGQDVGRGDVIARSGQGDRSMSRGFTSRSGTTERRRIPRAGCGERPRQAERKRPALRDQRQTRKTP